MVHLQALIIFKKLRPKICSQGILTRVWCIHALHIYYMEECSICSYTLRNKGSLMVLGCRKKLKNTGCEKAIKIPISSVKNIIKKFQLGE
ncbi:hypothetical protein AOLI_G00124470, partial [Acnodon oligacanthus]